MKKLLAAALLSFVALATTTTSAHADLCCCLKKIFCCHHCCESTVCLKPYNAFSPICVGDCYPRAGGNGSCGGYGGGCASGECGMPASPYMGQDMSNYGYREMPVTMPAGMNGGPATNSPAPSMLGNGGQSMNVPVMQPIQSTNFNPMMQAPAMGNAFQSGR